MIFFIALIFTALILWLFIALISRLYFDGPSWIGTGFLLFSFCSIIFLGNYLEQIPSWWNNESFDSVSPLKSVPMESITDMDNVSGSTYLLDRGESYLFYHKVLDHREGYLYRRKAIYRLEPIRIPKESATVICDSSIKSPYVQSYQACRKYRCPNPALVQVLLFPFCYLEDGEYLTRRDPDGEITYEIVISDMSVISALPAGAE